MGTQGQSCPNVQAHSVQAPAIDSSAILNLPWFSVMKVSLPPSRASFPSGRRKSCEPYSLAIGQWCAMA